MPRKGSSSSRWRQRQQADGYVKARDREGFRSRAAFKLQELDRRDRLLARGLNVLDLGASPGGWTQVAARAVGPAGTVVAVDVLTMEPVVNSVFIEGDCRDGAVKAAVREAFKGEGADLVMSDMAPNITGVAAADEAAAAELARMLLEYVREDLRPGGSLVAKLFQYPDTDAVFGEIRAVFTNTWRRKPPASRASSREFYVVAKGYGI